jgi:hypothetical protein
MRAVKIRASLVRCGTCGKPKRLGERHVCVTRLDKKPRTGKTTVQPKLRLSYGKCPTCQKEITSWPHTCTVKTDFRKRKAEQAKQEKAERAAAARKQRRRHDDHPPASECPDEDCPRYPCVQARIAWARGHQAGHAAGHDEGHAEGYAEGYAAGESAAG